MPYLNPGLYQALTAAFAQVRVSNNGELRQVQQLPDWQDGGRLRSDTIASGEQYYVNCPYCGDERQRLYFSYLWGERDPATGSDNLHLVNCRNENCVASRERRRELYHRVYPLGRERSPVPFQPSTVPLPAPFLPALPDGILIPLDQLPASHPAFEYLRQRNFDPAALWETWQVQYCELSLTARPSPIGRLVIPIYTADNRLAGWQARYVGDCPPDQVKYLSCRGMKKSQLLYGLPAAINMLGEAVVMVEGPTDVWRLGPGAVALFGKDMSHHQQDLLDHYLPRRPIVVFLDRDAQDEAVELQRTLLSRGRVTVLAGLPDGRDDVGDCTANEAWQQVVQALEQLG